MNISRIQRLSIEGSWIVFGQIASIAGALALVRILTEYLTPEQYGQLALCLTITTFVNQTLLGGIYASVGRIYSIAAIKNDLNGFLNATKYLLSICCLVLLLIGIPLAFAVPSFANQSWTGLVLIAIGVAIIGGYNGVYTVIQTAARHRAVVAFNISAEAWLKVVISFGMISWIGSDSTVVLLAYGCSALLVYITQLKSINKIISRDTLFEKKPTDWVNQIWTYAWPFSAWGVFTWMQQISDRWALELFTSKNDVGLYAVLFQLGYGPISIVVGIVVTFIAPIMFQQSGDTTDLARNRNVKNLSRLLTALCLTVTLVAVLMAIFLHELLFQILVAEKYRSVSYLLPVVILAGGLFASGQMLALKIHSEMKINSLIWPTIATALTGIALNLAGAYFAGLTGVVFGLVGFSLIYLMTMILLSRK